MSVNPDKTPIISKRDGSTEPFSTPKLRRCLDTLLREAGFDAHLATPLSKAVGLHIQRCDDDVPLTSSYVFDCVHAVLSQTGLREAADGFRAHRDRRRGSRARISVIDESAASQVALPWDKACLIATLKDKFGLRHAVSRYLASEIEHKVFALEYQSVSRQLLSALVRNELSSWGLRDDGIVEPCGAVAERRTDSPHNNREN